MLRIKNLRINISQHLRATIASYKIMSGNESQKHGFTWEHKIILNVFRVSDDIRRKIKYTAKMDLPAALNKLDGCDVSIKTTGSPNTVCMGDCLRVYDSICSNKPLHLVVVIYKQDDVNNRKKLIEIIQVDITGLKGKLFGGITREEIEELVNAVKRVPHDRKPTAEEHKAMFDIQKIVQEKSCAIYLNIKCDSKQSRLQCSFNKFLEFIERNPDKIIARSKTNEFRGGVIPMELESGRRARKKKCNPTSTIEPAAPTPTPTPTESTISQE